MNFFARHDVTPGIAWIGNQQHLIVTARIVTKGRRKNMIECRKPKFDGSGTGIFKAGRRYFLERRSIIKMPDTGGIPIIEDEAPVPKTKARKKATTSKVKELAPKALTAKPATATREPGPVKTIKPKRSKAKTKKATSEKVTGNKARDVASRVSEGENLSCADVLGLAPPYPNKLHVRQWVSTFLKALDVEQRTPYADIMNLIKTL